LALCAGLVCNVSLFLYSRQCRYYGPVLLCSIAIVCLYLRWNGRRSGLAAIAMFLICLLAANYINYVALCVCLAADCWIWREKEHRPTLPDWLLLLLPQIVAGAFIVSIWNPLRFHPAPADNANWFAQRLALFWWNWRDMNHCEFGALVLLVLASFSYLLSRDRWLLRAPMALFIYVTVVTLCSPQPIASGRIADVRYLVPVIPLCIAIEALALVALARKWPRMAVLLGLLAFGTNLFNEGPLLFWGLRSSIASYLGEIINPPSDPYTRAAQWINQNVRDGESIWVQPDYAVYPLMFHAPKAIYAWQLADPPAPQFAHLPDIYFQGRQPPDYLIIFGPNRGAVTRVLSTWNRPGVAYQPITTIDCYWRDLYRPELVWRTFKPVTNYSRTFEAIYILKQVAKPVPN
jgi:hypothetical protein